MPSTARGRPAERGTLMIFSITPGSPHPANKWTSWERWCFHRNGNRRYLHVPPKRKMLSLTLTWVSCFCMKSKTEFMTLSLVFPMAWARAPKKEGSSSPLNPSSTWNFRFDCSLLMSAAYWNRHKPNYKHKFWQFSMSQRCVSCGSQHSTNPNWNSSSPPQHQLNCEWNLKLPSIKQHQTIAVSMVWKQLRDTVTLFPGQEIFSKLENYTKLLPVCSARAESRTLFRSADSALAKK